MSEYIYILTNPSTPDIVKIGRTFNLSKHKKTLDSCDLPTPYEYYYVCMVDDSRFTLNQIYKGFNDYRTNPNKDFFKIDPDKIVSILKLVEVVYEEDSSLDRISQKFNKFKKNLFKF